MSKTALPIIEYPQDRVWVTLERRVSMGVDSYESFNVQVGSSATVTEGETRTSKHVELVGEVTETLLATVEQLRRVFGLDTDGVHDDDGQRY